MASKRMIHTDLLAFDVPGGDSGTGKERRDIISCWEKDLVFMSGCFLREAFIVGCFVTFKKVLFLSQFILIKKNKLLFPCDQEGVRTYFSNFKSLRRWVNIH